MSGGFEARRLEHAARYPAVMMEAIVRLGWDRETLEHYRTGRLRRLLNHAKQASPWHSKRLAHIDPETATLADLARIEPMTKDDLIRNWDAIVTDSRLTLERAERFLETLSDMDDLDEETLVLASGGSSGLRGVIAVSWSEAARILASGQRWGALALAAAGVSSPADVRMATLGSGASHHGLSLFPQLFRPANAEAALFGMDDSISAVAARLKEFNPTLLLGYASALNLVAAALEAQSLSLQPAAVIATSDPLLPDVAERIQKVFGRRAINMYGTCEAGVLACGCGQADGMHLHEDMAAFEFSDPAGRPIQDGETAAFMRVTPFEQLVLPLIRYEMTDCPRPLGAPCSCGRVFARIADLEGRSDDVFEYGKAVVHPAVFALPLRERREIIEFQVRQTSKGADIDLRCDGAVDDSALAGEIEAGLKRAGLNAPIVRLRRVDAIPRTSAGKLKRYIAAAH